MLDMICQAFQCTPDEAMRQDPALVFSVLDARKARIAMDYHRDDNMGEMPPSLVTFWREFTGDLGD